MAPFFQDHRLHGRVVVPAASHIAILLTALRQLGRPMALADLIFPSPLILPDVGARLAQVVVGAGSVRLLTAPDEADAAWATHLEGRVAAVAGSVAPSEPGLGIAWDWGVVAWGGIEPPTRRRDR